MVRCLHYKHCGVKIEIDSITLKQIIMKRTITYSSGFCLMMLFLTISFNSLAQSIKKKYPDGTIVYSDGSMRHPNGVITYPNSSSTRYPQVGNTTVRTLPDGSVIYPDGTIHHPNGVYTYPKNRTQRYPDGRVLYPDGTVRYPDGRVLNPNGGVVNRNNVYRYPQNGRWLPPGQAKKLYGKKSAREFAPGQRKKLNGNDRRDNGFFNGDDRRDNNDNARQGNEGRGNGRGKGKGHGKGHNKD
jgi:hypothetical protein